MSEPAAAKQSRHDRLKMAAIPVLAVILLLVVFRSDPESAEAEATAAAPAGGETPAPVVKTGAPKTAAEPPPAWPRISLQHVLQHDPFGLPDEWKPRTESSPERTQQKLAAQAEAAEAEEAAARRLVEEQQQREAQERAARAARLQSWRDKRVSLIYMGPKGRTAVVDGRIVAVGDRLDEDIRVLEITSDEIVLGLEL